MEFSGQKYQAHLQCYVFPTQLVSLSALFCGVPETLNWTANFVTYFFVVLNKRFGLAFALSYR